MVELHIPSTLLETCAGDAQAQRWLTELPRLVLELRERWQLTLEPAFDNGEGSCSWVAPASTADGSALVLKVCLPHFEARDEIAGLRFWAGEGSVRLLDADASRVALLLERCLPGVALRALPESEQDRVIAGLLRRLWRPPPKGHGFRALGELLEAWKASTLRARSDWPDSGLVQAGLTLFQELAFNAPTSALLMTDLHAGNVLSATRAPWLAIDPKPFVGDPAYDATQHLRNCLDRLELQPERTIARFAELLGLEAERVRRWIFARAAAEPRHNWRGDRWFGIARRLAPRMS